MNGMKTAGLAMIALATVLWTAAPGWAGNGTATSNATSSGDCSGIMAGENILLGEPFTATGQVVSDVYGQGIQIDTGFEIVTVQGIGPESFWVEQGVARPDYPDVVTIDGYMITLSDGSTRYIAFSVTIEDVIIQLRDTEDGTPLWRQIENKYNKDGSGQGGSLEEETL